MQLHDRCQGRSCCCCFHQFPKQQPTLHVPCQPPSSLTNRCSTPLRSNTPHVESSRRVWSRCFSRSSLEPQQGCLSRTQPPSPLPEARVEGTESNRQHGEEPQAQEQLLTAIRHAASLQQLRALFVQLQQCHERRDGSLGTSDMRLTLFTLFLRAGKLLLHRQKDLDRSLLQRIRSMARPNQQRPGLNMPTPSLVHPAPPTTYSHPMQQPPLQQSTLQQKMQGAQDAARSCQAGQGSINDGSNSSSTPKQDVTYVVYFYTEWSAKCRHGYTLFADLANRYTTDKLRFFKLDVGVWPHVGTVADVEVSCVSSQLPSVITYEKGQEDRRVPSTRKNRKHIFSRLDLINGLGLDIKRARSLPAQAS
mmetsp:Transcript_17855/g.46721  ORF Transcript_17855/g.46721 Transcript_17855/m.46721 type:complete len:363 (+) Transcript_17855:120-1208(+)